MKRHTPCLVTFSPGTKVGQAQLVNVLLLRNAGKIATKITAMTIRIFQLKGDNKGLNLMIDFFLVCSCRRNKKGVMPY